MFVKTELRTKTGPTFIIHFIYKNVLSALDLPRGNNKTHVKYEFMPLVCNISPSVHCNTLFLHYVYISMLHI